MKLFRKITSAVLSAALLCSGALLTSCAGGEAEYKVNVKNALGDPYTTGIVVQFMQDGEQVAMQAVNDKGVATKTLPKGDYTVELSFTDSKDAYYFKGGVSLSAKETEADAILANKITEEPTPLFASGEEFDAYSVSAGCTYVQLTEGKRSYFLFSPREAGTYEISLIDAEGCTLGYYGAPHFVQEQSLEEVKDNKFSVSVSSTMIGSGDTGTSTYVIGIDNEGAESCVLGIDRTGDPKKTIEDYPWTIYEATHEMKPYTLPAGASIKEFDLTAATDTYKLVYNEKDEFYHLNSEDGPLVLVRLAEDCGYIACFETILDRSGVSRYFFDKDGELEKKVSYSECLLEYIPCADENMGVYPLTEDLKHIIQNRGEYVGWWDIESSGYIFKDMDGNNDSTINADIAWLLMCCYIG